MKLRITSGVVLDGEPRFEGEVVETKDERIARQLIASGRAEEHIDPAPEPKPTATATRAINKP